MAQFNDEEFALVVNTPGEKKFVWQKTLAAVVEEFALFSWDRVLGKVFDMQINSLCVKFCWLQIMSSSRV